jgi:phage-related minor tail protein
VLGFDTIPTAAEGLERITAGFGEKVDELRAEIREMIEAPLPSTQILARLEEVTAGARKMAEEIAASAPAATAAADEVTESAKEKVNTLGSDISDALVTGVTDGKEGMLRSFSNILTEMASQVLKSQLMNAFKSIFPGGGASGGGLSGIFGSIGAALGFRADGGSVMGGRPYIVGERGPELMVPGRSGAVVANDQIGGGGLTYAPVVNISGGASAQDRAIFSAELRRQKAEIADMLARRRF